MKPNTREFYVFAGMVLIFFSCLLMDKLSLGEDGTGAIVLLIFGILFLFADTEGGD